MRTWEISGPGWVLPVKHSESSEVTFAVPMLRCQEELIRAVVEEYGWMVDDRMFIEEERMKSLGVPSLQVDPEQCVHWTPQERRIINSPVETEEEHKFLEAWCQQGWERSVDRAAVIWSSLCRHMLDWMLFKGKPLDLKFVRLEAFPFRPQWKELSLAQLSKDELERIDEREVQLKLAQNLKDPRMLMVGSRGSQIMRWSITAEETAWLERNCMKRERSYEKLHGASYWSIARQRVANLIPSAIESLLAFVCKTSRPFPQLNESGKHCPPDRAGHGGMAGKAKASQATFPLRWPASGDR